MLCVMLGSDVYVNYNTKRYGIYVRSNADELLRSFALPLESTTNGYVLCMSPIYEPTFSKLRHDIPDYKGFALP